MAPDSGNSLDHGVAISLREPLPTPPSVLHYEPGRLVHRHFVRNGQPWIATYKAEWDGVGFLVVEASCRPLVIGPGDFVHLRTRVHEHHGDSLMVEYEFQNGRREIRQVPIGAVVFLEQAPSLVPGGK